MDSQVQVQRVACVSCGAALSVPPDIDQLTCAYCGTALVIRRGDGYIASKLAEEVRADIRQVGDNLGARLDRVQDALGIESESAGFKCVRCGKSGSVTGVTEVVQQDTTTKAVNGVELTSTTEVARKLSYIPVKFSPHPFHEKKWLVLIVGSILAWVVLGGVFADVPAMFGVITLLLLASWVVLARKYRRAYSAHKEREYAAYQEAMATRQECYDLMYYCSRCDIFFMPGEDIPHDVDDLDVVLDMMTPGDWSRLAAARG